jgi:rare lipoprotein A
MIASSPAKSKNCRAAWLSLATLLLAACAGPQTKQQPQPSATPQAQAHPGRKPWKPLGPYTPGGLYAPGVADGAPDVPPDIANLSEPVPHPEPPSHYGNRSPYVVLGKTYTVLPSAAGYDERGMASWYGTKFDGRVTSSLEPYDLTQFTAAHRTLPLPSYARVTNLENGRSVIVRINDRGPFHDGRLIDLSYAAAIKLGVNVHGTAMVEVHGIDTSQPYAPSPSDAAVAKPAVTHAVAASPKRAVAMPESVASAVLPLSDATTTRSDAAKKPDVGSPLPVAGTTKGAAPSSEASDADARAVVAAPVASPSASIAPTPDSTYPAAGTPPAVAAAMAAAAAAPLRPPITVPSPTPLPAAALPATPAAATSDKLPVTTSGPPIAASASTNLPAPSIGRPAIDPSTRGFLQVASYGDRGNAERMLQRLQQAGVEHAELVSVQVADQILWRVHIGPMRADEAAAVAARLDALGFGTPPFFKE